METEVAASTESQLGAEPQSFSRKEPLGAPERLEFATEGNKPQLHSNSTATFCCQSVSPQNAPSGHTDLPVVPLTQLQELIHDILDPRALGHRTIKDWRSLYRSFFDYFSPGGPANEREANAWAIAFAAFNRNLVAVNNRSAQIVPMTFQDCVDGSDSFRHDGLLESTRRDIVWQPKKILLLMAAMIGRIVSGWQADALFPIGRSENTSPFGSYLIGENRKAGFLGYIFDHDPRFSVVEYRAAGLKSLLHSFPHCAEALIENGLRRCECIVPEVPGRPAFLRLHFLRSLRVPISLRNVSTLDIFPLKTPLPAVVVSRDSQTEISHLESGASTLEALAFTEFAPLDIKRPKIQELFELAIHDRLAVGTSYRPGPLTAKWSSEALGRTQAEQFVIEQFFALGFKSGSGNEPWNDQTASEPHEQNPDKLRQIRKQFEHWWDAVEFFSQAGFSEVAGIPGARTRQGALQPKGNGSPPFLALLRTPVYAHLMQLLLALDPEGGWLVKEPDIFVVARGVNNSIGRLLIDTAPAVASCANTLPNEQLKATFLFECSLGIFLGIPLEQKSTLKQTRIEEVRDALRHRCESLFNVTLANAPSARWSNPQELALRIVETKNRIQTIEQAIWNHLGEPLAKQMGEALTENLELLTAARNDLHAQTVPTLQLSDEAAFAQSVNDLCAWVAGRNDRSSPACVPSADELLPGLAEVRLLTEAGDIATALERSAHLVPLLTRKKKEHLAPFFAEFPSLTLSLVEQELALGRHEKATALAAHGRLLFEGIPALGEYEDLLQELFRAKTPDPAPGSSAASASAKPGSQPPNPRVFQAQTLLSDYAEELAINENGLERDFLKAVVEGCDAAFQRKTKLEHRLEKLTRWGGREPHMTTLRLLRTSLEPSHA